MYSSIFNCSKQGYLIENIIKSIIENKIRITDHADEEAHSDNLTFDEVYTSVINGEIIEDYPRAVLITVYRPDPDRWIDWKTRRKK